MNAYQHLNIESQTPPKSSRHPRLTKAVIALFAASLLFFSLKPTTSQSHKYSDSDSAKIIFNGHKQCFMSNSCSRRFRNSQGQINFNLNTAFIGYKGSLEDVQNYKEENNGQLPQHFGFRLFSSYYDTELFFKLENAKDVENGQITICMSDPDRNNFFDCYTITLSKSNKVTSEYEENRWNLAFIFDIDQETWTQMVLKTVNGDADQDYYKYHPGYNERGEYSELKKEIQGVVQTLKNDQ